MIGFTLKYSEYLKRYPHCPPENYIQGTFVAFRWVFSNELTDSFKPLNIIDSPPPRMLDDTDKLCKGYGLSFFTSFELGEKKYKRLYKKKRGTSHEEFIAQKGNAIAEVHLYKSDGIYGDINKKTGHFTFHEYKMTELSCRVELVEQIFDQNDNFRR